MKLTIGAIYKNKSNQFSNEFVRLMTHDQGSILYEPQDYGTKWYFENLVRRSIYFRYEPSYFLNNFEFIEEMPYSEEQQRTYRPDLPCHLLLSRHLDFTNPISEIVQTFDMDGLGFAQPLPAVYLIPKTRKNSDKTPVLVKAESGGLTLVEILETALALRKEWVPEATDIGIHRSGHKQRIPSYYISGFDDLANHVSKWETVHGMEYDWRKALASNT